MIEVAGKQFITLDDEFFIVNDDGTQSKVIGAYANGEVVYPDIYDGNPYICKIVGHTTQTGKLPSKDVSQMSFRRRYGKMNWHYDITTLEPTSFTPYSVTASFSILLASNTPFTISKQHMLQSPGSFYEWDGTDSYGRGGTFTLVNGGSAPVYPLYLSGEQQTSVVHCNKGASQRGYFSILGMALSVSASPLYTLGGNVYRDNQPFATIGEREVLDWSGSHADLNTTWMMPGSNTNPTDGYRKYITAANPRYLSQGSVFPHGSANHSNSSMKTSAKLSVLEYGDSFAFWDYFPDYYSIIQTELLAYFVDDYYMRGSYDNVVLSHLDLRLGGYSGHDYLYFFGEDGKFYTLNPYSPGTIYASDHNCVAKIPISGVIYNGPLKSAPAEAMTVSFNDLK